MKDYFASIVPEGVTGVTKRTTAQKVRFSERLPIEQNVTRPSEIKCNRCNASTEMLHPVHLGIAEGVTRNSPETLALHPVHSDTPTNEIWRELYEERSAVYQFDGNKPQAEAERLAYQDALMEFLSWQYPALIEQFSAMVTPIQIH